MNDPNLPRPSGDTVEDGVPATEEVRDEILQTGDTGMADMPMPDRPMGADKWGITDFEQQAGDSLDRRLRREEPENPLSSREGERVLEPGADVDFDDVEAEALGETDPSRSDTLSAEEAAMRVVDEDELRR